METQGHNHPPDWDEQLRGDAMNEALEKMMENPNNRNLPKYLYNQAKENVKAK